ncbi:MAG: cytochrome c [Herminiimonas sp.]|nr:cytochrome c [Herminiimonas sp.]
MLATACLIALIGMAAGAVVMKAGWYNVAATDQHWQPVYSLLEKALYESVRARAREIPERPLTAWPMIARGATVYRDNCLQCHGGPGVAQSDFGKSMQPVPGPLVDAAKRWRANEMYWITRHGIKLSGMPAWELHLSDDDMWAVVAFLSRLPELSPQEFSLMTAATKDGR